MALSNRAEEILETLWVTTVEQEKGDCDFTLLRDDEVIKELQTTGLVKVAGTRLQLTDNGREEAKSCIRRHRLAERLLADVLDCKQQMLHDTGCKFEHLLHEGLEENICTLLGHPSVCPHGNPIPEGECCKKVRSSHAAAIIPLSEMDSQEMGKIAYLQTRDHEAIQKIIAIGALPNTQIKVLQTFPSYVFQVSKSQFAIDKELASQIYVRRMGK